MKEDSPTLNIPERVRSFKYMVSPWGAELQLKSSITFSVLCCLLFPSLCLQPQARSSPIYVAICMQIRGYFQMHSAPCRRQAAFKNVFFPRMTVKFSVSILFILHLLAGCCSWHWFISILKPRVSYTSLHPTESLCKFPLFLWALHLSLCILFAGSRTLPCLPTHKSQEPAPNLAHTSNSFAPCLLPSLPYRLTCFISLSIIISVFPGLPSAIYDNAVSILALFLLDLDSFLCIFLLPG